MNPAPKVSVLIPAYNYGHMLDDAITSVLNQSFNDFELIIVDNCSHDNSTQVVSNYLTDERIKYYKNDINIGLSRNWNKCLELAKGKYLKFLCADDKFHPQLLERYVQIMEENQNISIITCKKQEFTNHSLTDKICDAPFNGLVNGHEIIKYIILNDKNILGSPTRVMFRKDNLSIGQFRNYKFITDLEMWVRHLCIGDCYFLNDVLAFGRIHDGQQQINSKKYSEDRIEYYHFYRSLLQGNYAIDNQIISRSFIQQCIKRIAIKCTYNFYKHLPKISSQKHRKSLYILFKIGLFEKLIISPHLLEFIKEGINKKEISKFKNSMKVKA